MTEELMRGYFYDIINKLIIRIFHHTMTILRCIFNHMSKRYQFSSKATDQPSVVMAVIK